MGDVFVRVIDFHGGLDVGQAVMMMGCCLHFSSKLEEHPIYRRIRDIVLCSQLHLNPAPMMGDALPITIRGDG